MLSFVLACDCQALLFPYKTGESTSENIQVILRMVILRALSKKRALVLILVILISSDFAIMLDAPILRQISGLLLITVLPGFLILSLLKLNRLEMAGKIVLTLGLSIAFLMLFGWILSQAGLLLGYSKPLETNNLLLALNSIIVVLALAACISNRDAFSALPFHFSLNTESKLYLLLPATFPLISILGVFYLNSSGNNIILLALLLFLIPVSIILMILLKSKLSKDTYLLTIVLISSTLLLKAWLRSEHVVGHDVHMEYYTFYMTLVNGHWSILEDGVLDSCLSISLLPTIFQSLLHLQGEEYLFKGVYASICLFTPLCVFVVSKKYIGELYAFLATFYFISQSTFLSAPGGPRTNIAILFFALSIMVLFGIKTTRIKRRGLLMIFIAAAILSHYSTTYIFWILLLATFLLSSIFFRKDSSPRNITLYNVTFFAVLIVLWYDVMTGSPFRGAVSFSSQTISNLQRFFLEEARSREVGMLFGTRVGGEIILSWVHLIVTWLSFTLIAIGVIGTLVRRHDMIGVAKSEGSLPQFLGSSFETEYFLMSVTSTGLLVTAIVLPYVSVGYDIFRLYTQAAVLLSVFLIIGGIMLAKFLRVKVYLLLLLVLIPYFLFTTWAAYEAFGFHRSLGLSSEAPSMSYEYIHDQEIPAATWLKEHIAENSSVYAADPHGRQILISQGKIFPGRVDGMSFSRRLETDDFLYLSHNNVVEQTLVVQHDYPDDLSEYSDMLTGKNKLYTNGGSEIYK